jgi:hypothetical protein
MHLTLYKTASPTAVDEYYELTLKTKRSWGKTEEYLEINHGWWDAQKKESKKDLEILNTLGTDAFPTFTDALQQLNHYKQYYARNGFVHAFSKDVLTNKDEHELIKPL